VAQGTEPPASWAFAQVQPQYGYDKAKAAQLLDAAGFKKGSDGIRANGDLKLQFEIITNKDNTTRMNVITAMQNQWKEIGVDCTPRGVDFNLELVPQLTNQRNFQTLLVGFQWNSDPDQQQVFASANTAPGGFNGMSYKNPTLDKLLSDAVATTDKNKRKQLYKQMQQTLAEDVPAPVLLYSNDIVVTNKRVQGFTPNAFAQRYSGRRRYIKDVYVTDGK
jgi:peptide/nickel transport system substrate-binding protein